ncbi:hypothetical protein ACS0TY_006244 [Phlomoides rotata]
MKTHSLFGSCLLRIKSHSLCVSVNSLSTTLSDNTTEHLITAERSSDVEDFEGPIGSGTAMGSKQIFHWICSII